MLTDIRHNAIVLLLLVTATTWSCVGGIQPAFAQEAAPVKKTPDPRNGTRVIVTKAGATLRTPTAVVWCAYLGETFTVSLTNGPWLWINDKRGWLAETDTVPFKTAVQDLSKKIQEAPTPENYHLRGIAYVAHREYDRAIADFTQSLKMRGNIAGVLNNRGQAYYLKGEYDTAIRDLSAAIAADPRHFVAMNNRALCFIAGNDLPRAKADLDAALTLHKEYPEALNNRGVVYSRQGNYKAAVGDLSAALKIYDNYTDAYGNRSFAYRKQSMFTEAIADLKTAMEKDPLDYKPINDYAWILATANNNAFRDPEAAVAQATRACQMTQYENWNTLDTLAVAYSSKRDFKTAQQWVTTALAKAPERYKPRLMQHQQLITAGKPIPQ